MGCFDFIEDLQLKSDGSGTIKATLNMSQSGSKVASLMKLKNLNGYEIPSKDKIEREVIQMVHLLKNTPGISQVNYQLDFTNYIASVSCSFTNINALNAFSETVASHFKTSIQNTNHYAFHKDSQVFKRTFQPPVKVQSQLAKFNETDQKLLDNAYYTQIMRFDTTIKSYSNTNAKKSASSKSLFLKTKVTDLIQGKTSIQNTISLNK